MINYYKLLNIPPSSDIETINRAYKKIAHTVHPDKGGKTEDFILLKEAADTLTDEKKRAIYNKKLIEENVKKKYLFYEKGVLKEFWITHPEITGEGSNYNPFREGSYEIEKIGNIKLVYPKK